MEKNVITKTRSLCWLRRDLRLHDHVSLSQSLRDNDETILVFIFDENILNKIHNKNDFRVTFIMDSLKEIENECRKYGSSLLIHYGDPVKIIPQLLFEYKAESLYFNRDYEPYAKSRDQKIAKLCQQSGITVNHFKDHVFYEKHEILNGSGEIYKVFTPYKNKWLEKFNLQEKIISNYTCDLKKTLPL